jgi:PAS domain S-box-containing protein
MTITNLDEPNHRILVVDDNPAIHDDLRKVLGGDSSELQDLASDEALLFGTTVVPATSFEIDSAYQGEEGLEKVKQALSESRPYAMAFIDVRMPPGWDGIETITRVRKVDPDLQTVICTAFSDYSWMDIQRRLGHSDNLLILKKPFDNIEVIQLAHALTRKWMLNRQARTKMADLDRMVGQRTAELQAANGKVRHEFEERVKAEDRYSLVIEATHDGIFDWNVNTGECYFSPRYKQILGYEDEELPNDVSSFFDRIHLDDRERIANEIAFNREQPTVDTFGRELRIRHRDGLDRWVASRGRNVRDADGKLLRVVGSITDVGAFRGCRQTHRERKTLAGHPRYALWLRWSL